MRAADPPGTVTPTSPGPRLARAAVLAAVVLVVSLAGHLVGGGAIPPAALVVVASLPAFGLAVLLSGRRVGPVGAAAFVAAGQTALHPVFALGSLAPRTAPGAAAHAGHGLLGAAPSIGVEPAEHAAHAAHGLDGLAADPRMVAGHLLAAVVAGAVLGRIERALFFVAGLWSRPLRLVGAAAPRAIPLVVPRPRTPVLRGVEVACAPSRGPPVAATAAIRSNPVP